MQMSVKGHVVASYCPETQTHPTDSCSWIIMWSATREQHMTITYHLLVCWKWRHHFVSPANVPVTQQYDIIL